MKKLSSLPIKFQIFLVIALLAVFASAIIVYSSIYQRHKIIADAKKETQTLTALIAAQNEAVVSSAQQLMIALSQMPQLQGRLVPELEKTLAQLIRRNPQYAAIIVTDPKGGIWASAPPTGSRQVSDRDSFARAIANGRFSAGQYLEGQLSGKQILSFYHPYYNGRHGLAGMIILGIDLSYLRRVMEMVAMPPHFGYLLLDHNGMILSDGGHAGNFTGQRYESETFEEMNNGPDVYTYLGMGHDGRNRFISYRKLRLAGEEEPYMYIRSGTPVAPVLLQANRMLAYNLAVLLTALLLVSYLAWLVGNRSITARIALLEKSSLRLAEGDLTVRVADLVPGGELGNLGATFDHMAEQLALRDRGLKESRAILQQVLDTAPRAIFWKDRQGVYLGCNAVFARTVGLEDAELIKGKTDFDLPWPSAEAEAYRSDDREVVEGNRPKLHIIEPLQQADGTRIWIDTSKVPLVDQQGEVYGVLAVFEDITQRKEAEEKLRKSEAQLRASQEVAKLGSWELDAGSQALEWSDETYRLFDRSPRDFTPTLEAFIGMVHPDDRDHLQSCLEKALAGGDQPCHALARVNNDSGRTWIMEVHGTVSRDRMGKATRIIGTVQDVTATKKTEEILRRNEKMLRNLLDSVDEGFIVIDRDYRILSANRAYGAMVGRDPAEVVGGYCYQISHSADRPCFEEGEPCASRAVFETGEPQVTVHRHPAPGGGSIYVETKAFPLPDESGRVTSVIEVVNNITEKMLLEEQRLKTQKLEAVGTLAGGIAHDFNNLLQGIFGYISMARMSIDEKQKCLKMLTQAEKALQMSVKLTGQLLTFAKGGKPVRKKFDPRPVVTDSVKFGLSGSSVDYEMDLADDLWLVEADEGQISQVIQNLVINSEQAMPLGGTVRVAMKNVNAPGPDIPASLTPGRYVEFKLTDSGTGIPKEYLQKIFDPYFTTKKKGNGLGLATAYSILQRHGSTIEVQSEPGRGSTFLFWLPAVVDRDEGAAELPPVAQVKSKYRVLVMDDDQMVRKLAGVMLEQLGQEAVFASNGEEALAEYREALAAGQRFDLVLLDLTIRGGMGGVETIKALRDLDPEVKAVVTSGYADSDALAEYLSLGFAACLTKPYTLEGLNDTLNSVLQ